MFFKVRRLSLSFMLRKLRRPNRMALLFYFIHSHHLTLPLRSVPPWTKREGFYYIVFRPLKLLALCSGFHKDSRVDFVVQNILMSVIGFQTSHPVLTLIFTLHCPRLYFIPQLILHRLPILVHLSTGTVLFLALFVHT